LAAADGHGRLIVSDAHVDDYSEAGLVGQHPGVASGGVLKRDDLDRGTDVLQDTERERVLVVDR
jgi:hypothetical protein